MNAPLLRRGACPTLREPMQTGDGLLARLYPVDGGLTPGQLLGLARAASRHGNGILEITQRGSLQVRGLTVDSTQAFAAEVDALGIAVRDGVAVETGPLAGLDPDELADPRQLARAIRAGIAARSLAPRLGPKVSVVIDGGGRWSLSAFKADVRVEARNNEGATRWRVSVATSGGLVCRERLDDAAAALAAVVVLHSIAAQGRQARSTDLSPGEVEDLLAAPRPVAAASVGEINAAGAISLLEGEISGRTEGGAGVTQLTDGRFATVAALAFGSIDADVLAEFVESAANAGATEFRLAPNRTLLAICPSSVSAEAVTEVARSAGLAVDADDPRSGIVACPGAPACASGHIPAREMGKRIAAALPDGLELDLHISGCAKRCAKPGHVGLSLLGTADVTALVLDGNGAGSVADAVSTMPASALAYVAKERAEAAFRRVAALLAAERKDGEASSQTIRRIGRDRLADAFASEGR